MRCLLPWFVLVHTTARVYRDTALQATELARHTSLPHRPNPRVRWCAPTLTTTDINARVGNLYSTRIYDAINSNQPNDIESQGQLVPDSNDKINCSSWRQNS